MKSLFQQISELENLKIDAALCTVVATSGSTPRKIGTKMIVMDDEEGGIIGTIGGGAIEHLIIKKAKEVIRIKKPKLFTTSLRNELGMCCGGEMTVFIEPIAKKPRFVCFGAGHIAQALCPMMLDLGFSALVVDERSNLLNLKVFSQCEKLNDSSSFAIKDLDLHECYILIATHDHGLDQKIVENILPATFKYAALVGSKRKALMTTKRLLAKGFSETDIRRLYCPAGLEIFAQTPKEIALSISSQIIMIKNDQNPSISIGDAALNEAPKVTSTPSFLSTSSKAPKSPMRSISST